MSHVSVSLHRYLRLLASAKELKHSTQKEVKKKNETKAKIAISKYILNTYSMPGTDLDMDM